MKITDIRVRKIAKEGKLKAVVSITIDDEFVIHDIKVIDGDKGLFIAMPSKKTGDGDYRLLPHGIYSVQIFIYYTKSAGFCQFLLTISPQCNYNKAN